MTDSEKELGLLADLNSEKRTLRISAIVQLSKISSNRQVLFRLQQMSSDKDREIALFVGQAIARIQSRLGDQPPVQLDQHSIGLQHFLTPLPAEIGGLLAHVRGNREKIPEDWRPVIAEFLEKNGEQSDVEILTGWLEHADSAYSLACLDALEALSPKSLTDALPRLLAFENPLVRVRAIRTLLRVDPDEAMAHFSELLGSRKVEERLAGISIAFVFDVAAVKPLIMATVSEETDDDVLKAIEAFLALNPEVETALQLLDLIEAAPKARTPALNRIFQKVGEGLKLAQILTPEEARPEALIARWRGKRMKKFLTDVEVQLTVCDKTRREAIEAWLSRNLQNPDVAKFVEKLAASPATEEMFLRLTGKASPVAELPTDLVNPEKRSDEEKCRILGNIDSAQFSRVAAWVRLEAASENPPVRSAALNALAQSSSGSEDIPLAEASISHQHPKVVLAAVRLLEKMDFSRLGPFLQTLLTYSDPAVRVKAIRLALRFDQEKAVETISNMLQSPHQSIRAQAVSCLLLCPFEQIFPMLLDTLKKETQTDIARQILLVLRSNPSVKVLDALDKIQAAANSAVSILIAQARMDLFDLLLSLGLDTEEAESPFSAPPIAAAKPPIAQKQLSESHEERIEPPPQGRIQGEATQKEPKPRLPESSVSKAIPAKTFSVQSISPVTTHEISEGERRSAGQDSPTPVQNREKSALSSPGAFPAAPPVPAKTAAGWTVKPYSVSEVRSAIRKREAANRTSAAREASIPTEMPQSLKKLAILAALGVFFGIVILTLNNFSHSPPPEPETKELTARYDNKPPEPRVGPWEGFKMGEMCRVSGKIEEVNPDGTMKIVLDDHRRLYVVFVASYPLMRGGENVEVEVVPYKNLFSGEIKANGYKITEKP